MDTGALTEIGFVIRTHGVKGYLRIAFHENIRALSKSEALFFLINERFVPYFIEDITNLESGNAIVLLEDVHSKEMASKLTRHTIYGPAGYAIEIPSEQSLVGFTVIDSNAGFLGEISGVTNMVEYLLLHLDYKGKELLIALHEHIIIQKDNTNQILEIEAPEGFLDL